MELTFPYPDEFVLGYAGRLRILNREKNAQQFGYQLRDHFMAPNGMRPSLIEALILATGQSHADFLKHHSLIGYHLAVTKKATAPVSSYLSRPDLIDSFGFRLIRNEARFCTSCIEAERKTDGVAYWHRNHQLPGVYWCHLHGEALRVSPGGNQDFWKSPEIFAEIPASWLADNVPDMLESESMQKYFGILKGILEAEVIYSVPHAKQRIRNLLAERGIRAKLIGTEPTLGQVVKRATPQFWFWVEYAWKIPREHRDHHLVNALDQIYESSSLTKAYAIALAVTHRSIEDALAYWY